MLGRGRRCLPKPPEMAPPRLRPQTPAVTVLGAECCSPQVPAFPVLQGRGGWAHTPPAFPGAPEPHALLPSLVLDGGLGLHMVWRAGHGQKGWGWGVHPLPMDPSPEGSWVAFQTCNEPFCFTLVVVEGLILGGWKGEAVALKGVPPRGCTEPRRRRPASPCHSPGERSGRCEILPFPRLC